MSLPDTLSIKLNKQFENLPSPYYPENPNLGDIGKGPKGELLVWTGAKWEENIKVTFRVQS